ncbi:MAG: caspase domain-containing protein [Myxococcales bacterium]
MKLAALIAVVVAAAPAHAASERIAILVGNNRGLPGEVGLRYAESDAQKIGKALTDLGGFDPGEIHSLFGGSADEVRALLKKLSRPSAGPSLSLFYYSGHGDAAGLHLSGTTLPFDELRDLLGGLGGKVSLSLIDSCASGAMTRAKGAHPGPSYDIDVLRDPALEGRIVITSSSEDEIAQESDRLEGSFFTYYWVSGLYGAADANGDNLVTLEEAFRFAHYRTLERTIESRVGVQRPSFALALAGQGQLVLANLSHSSARLEVARGSKTGQYFVLDSDKRLLLTEIATSGNGPAAIRVPPGKYRVRKREEAGSLVVDVTVGAGQVRTIEDADMAMLPYEEQVGKGDAGAHLVQEPQLSAGIRSGLHRGIGLGLDLRAAYRVSAGKWFVQPEVELVQATLVDAGRRFRHSETTLGFAGGLQSWAGPLHLAAGPEVGLVLFDDVLERAEAAPAAAGPPGSKPPESAPQGIVPIGFRAGVFAQAALRTVDRLFLTLDVAPGVVLYRNEGRRASSAVVGGGLGLLYSFP